MKKENYEKFKKSYKEGIYRPIADNLKENTIFFFYYVGLPCFKIHYTFIDKIDDDNYLVRKSNSDEIIISKKTYEKFLKKLKRLSKRWKYTRYTDPTMIDGWHTITYSSDADVYLSCNNDNPRNYSKLLDLIRQISFGKC